jgi:hypothetical protein
MEAHAVALAHFSRDLRVVMLHAGAAKRTKTKNQLLPELVGAGAKAPAPPGEPRNHVIEAATLLFTAVA